MTIYFFLLDTSFKLVLPLWFISADNVLMNLILFLYIMKLLFVLLG